eukprot:GFUD01010781.1.p1 GENE.GFUD01010781.1~~GFUD01010781.1.p1  ORF type:complete len:212 (-),score=36.99 GFUD01010781.1:511-1146(-)
MANKITTTVEPIWHAWYTTGDPGAEPSHKQAVFEAMKASGNFGPAGQFDPHNFECAAEGCNRKLDESTSGTYKVHGAHVYRANQAPSDDPNDCWIVATCNRHNPARSEENKWHYPRQQEAIKYLQDWYGANPGKQNATTPPPWTGINVGMKLKANTLLMPHNITKGKLKVDLGSGQGNSYNYQSLWANIKKNKGTYKTPTGPYTKGQGKGV